MTISQTISDFVTLAIKAGGWMEMDRIYLQNRVLAMIGEAVFEPSEIRSVDRSSIDLMDELVACALSNQQIGDSHAEREIFEAQLMDFLTPPPSVVNAFAQHYANDPKEATDFFELCRQNDYIKTRPSQKNIVFPVDTEYGRSRSRSIYQNLKRSQANSERRSCCFCRLSEMSVVFGK